MNTTLRRIVLTAPMATALLGLGLGAAHADVATKYGPDFPDSISSSPIVDPPPWTDPPIVSDPGPVIDFPVDDPADDPSDPPADPADTDEDSDDESDGTDTSHTSGSVAQPADNTVDSSEDTAGLADDETQATTDTELVAPVFDGSPTGYQIPAGATLAAGLLFAVLAMWAGYRHHRSWAAA